MSDAATLMIDELRAARQNMTDAVALIDELRAEVRMLRAVRDDAEAARNRLETELARERTRADGIDAYCHRVNDIITRVEVLAASWEEPYLGDFLPREAAKELRAALRGEP